MIKNPLTIASLGTLLALVSSSAAEEAEPNAEARELAARANDAMSEENWEEADRLLDEALEIAGDAPELWIGRGFARVRLDRIEDARESYETALALYEEQVEEDPENVGLVMNVGYTLVLLNRRDDAVAYLEDAAERHPDKRAFERFGDIIDGLEENFAEFIVPQPDETDPPTSDNDQPTTNNEQPAPDTP